MMPVLTFEDWIADCFSEKPKLDSLEPARVAEFMTRLFNNAMPLVGDLPSDRLGAGFTYILGGVSSYWWDVRDKSISKEIQVETVLALRNLYRDFFDVLCDGCGQKPARSTNDFDKLDGTVYMIWDMSVLEGAAMFPGEEHLVNPIFSVLSMALDCRTVACQVSGLHGLGHLHNYHPGRVGELVDGFLLRAETAAWVRDYAKQARSGSVL